MAAGRDFGTLINERRLELGYSLGQLANRVRATASDVRAWERGQHAPNAAVVARLAKELELDPEELGGAAQQVRSSSEKQEPARDDKTAVVAAPVFSDDAHTESIHPDDGDRVVAVAKEERPAAPEPEPKPQTTPAPHPASFDDDHDAGEDDEDSRPEPMPGERPFWEDLSDDDATALVVAAKGGPETDGLAAGDVPEAADPATASPDGPPLTDLPTEAVPIVPAAAASPAEPVATVLAPSRPATATQAPSQPTAGTSAFEPFTSFLRTLFDPDRRYLFWLRTVLMIIVFFVFLRILAWAVPAFFDALSEILDTIESTPTDTTVIPGR